jgi:dihydroorotase
MQLLIKNTTLTDPNSPLNGKQQDILIDNGFIKAIANPGSMEANGAEILDGTGTHTTPGFMDMRAQFADPGYEHREDILSGCKTAAAGGFTGVAVLPSTWPAVHSKSEVEYVLNKAKGQATSVYPMGCVTHNREGNELAELYDMHTAGAIAFTDGNKTITDSGLMHRALLYAKGFNGLLCVHPEDASMAQGGQMNEGTSSTHLGMKGIPNLAELLMVKRDIELARYNNTKVHFSHISTAEAVDLIRNAKADGLQITADVAIANLIWDDTALDEYETNYKLTPPLRTKTDIDALIKGLKDGTIDAICTDHNPQDAESKVVEYEYASNGMLGLQTFLPLALQLQNKLGWDVLVNAITANPRKILGLPAATIAEGQLANLTVFNSTEKWVYNKASNRSKSVNSPLWNTEMTGKILLTTNNNIILRF